MAHAPYRGVVIGCGSIGVGYEADKERVAPRSHAGALAAHSRVRLVALVDSDARVLAAAQKRFPQARGYRSAAQCLAREKPDIVVIATSTQAHFPIVRLACKYKPKMLICEKPLCHDSEEAAALAKAVKKSNAVFVLNYQRRFFPLFERVRADLARGAIGRIQQVTCYYSNGLYNNAGHTVDSLMFLLGNRIKNVSALKNDANRTYPAGDPNLDTLLTSESGVRITLQSFDNSAYPIHEYHFFGTKGSLSILKHGFAAEWRTLRKSAFPEFKATTYLERKESFVKGALDAAIRGYEKKSTPVSGIRNGTDVVAVLNGASRSAAQNGKIVQIRYS